MQHLVKVFLGLVCAATALANSPREQWRKFFQSVGKAKQFEAYETVPRISVDAFVQELLASGPLRFLGAGVEGLVYLDAKGRVWKLAIGLAHAFSILELPADHVLLSQDELLKTRQQWVGLRPMLEERAAFLRERQQNHWPMRSQTLERELVGTAFWSGFAPNGAPLPYFVSADGLGFCREHFAGPTLGEVLAQDRAGQTRYSMPKIWEKLVVLQRANDAMLAKTGVAVDAFSPLNFIVVGSFDDPSVVPIDNGLSLPQPSALPWLAERGIRPQANGFGESIGSFTTPLVVTPLIVSSGLWAFSYEQALQYVRTYTGATSRSDAVRALAAIPRLVNERYPALFDHANIERAQRESAGTGSGTGCGAEVVQ